MPTPQAINSQLGLAQLGWVQLGVERDSIPTIVGSGGIVLNPGMFGGMTP
jgi:hypothetical protein